MNNHSPKVLLDATYIASGGGLVLLNYFIRKLSKHNVEIYLLKDSRNTDNYDFVAIKNITTLSASVLNRHYYFKRHKRFFDIVFTINNLPPSVNLPTTIVYTYFHQFLFLKNSHTGNSLKMRLLLSIKKAFIEMNKKNTDYFVVQTLNMKNEFYKVFRFDPSRILVYPFFESEYHCNQEKTANSRYKYLYVSDGHPHKNHEVLLSAWEIVNSKYPTAHLTLTVSERNYPQLATKIQDMNRKGINVSNAGFQEKDKLHDLYKAHKFLVYPSLAESFGLGLIEATLYGCEIIASELDYVRAVVRPQLTFNPNDPHNIARAIFKSIESPGDGRKTELLIHDQVTELVQRIITPNPKPISKNRVHESESSGLI